MAISISSPWAANPPESTGFQNPRTGLHAVRVGKRRSASSRASPARHRRRHQARRRRRRRPPAQPRARPRGPPAWRACPPAGRAPGAREAPSLSAGARLPPQKGGARAAPIPPLAAASARRARRGPPIGPKRPPGPPAGGSSPAVHVTRHRHVRRGGRVTGSRASVWQLSCYVKSTRAAALDIVCRRVRRLARSSRSACACARRYACARRLFIIRAPRLVVLSHGTLETKISECGWSRLDSFTNRAVSKRLQACLHTLRSLLRALVPFRSSSDLVAAWQHLAAHGGGRERSAEVGKGEGKAAGRARVRWRRRAPLRYGALQLAKWQRAVLRDICAKWRERSARVSLLNTFSSPGQKCPVEPVWPEGRL
eukprot:1443191-Pyramimonas_sp.AAC.1